MSLAPGSSLGPYTIRAELGHGGMGVVYTAHDPRLKRQVAIKLLTPDLTRDETAKQRFLQEAQAASALDHPNICTIYEINETDDGQLYLVMAYYEGETLKGRIERGPLALDEAVDIATQVGQGLAEAHGAGIVHRDIKPANLLIAKGGLVKILDFGLAKLAGTEGVTQTGATVGTVAYMSPEQARGEEVDHRTDIWALGVVLYEMLAGLQPFQGENLLAISNAILQSRPSSLTGASSSAQSVVTRALSKTQSQRYQVVTDLLDELRRATARATQSRSQSDVPSIAVLPFANMSADPENEYFCDGITEDIINALTKLKGLRVMARTSSFSFKGTNPEIAEVGAKLKVATVLEGSVRRAGNRLRVTAQLVNAADGYHIWSERFDRDLEDVFAIQDEIATMIAERLKVTLTEAGTEPLVVRPTDSLEAYELYVKGRVFLYRRGASLLLALECFERAVALDPNYAHAWAGLADTRMSMGQWGVKPPGETIPAALEAAHRALALGPDLPEAHTARAFAASMNREWQTAEREFLRALELNPKHVQARCWYGIFYLCMVAGRWEDGVVETRRALDLDPLSAYATAMYGLALSCAGRHPEAIEQARLAVERDPVSFICRWVLQVNYLLAGHFSDSIEAGERALALSGRHVFALCQQVTAYARWGKTRKARAVHNELLARAEQGYVQPTLLALSAVAVGDVEDAVARAEAAYEERDCFLIVARHVPFCADLPAVPRIKAILDRMGAPDS